MTDPQFFLIRMYGFIAIVVVATGVLLWRSGITDSRISHILTSIRNLFI